MISYNEFIEYLRNENNFDDIELALAMFCIEEQYGTYLEALEANGYEEADRETYAEALEAVSNEFFIDHEYDNCYSLSGEEFLIFDDYDEAKSAAIDSAKEIIDDCGYECVNGWEDYVDEEWFKDAIRESFESYAEDIEEEFDSTYGNRLVQECYDRDLIDDDDFEVDENGDIDYTECTVDSYKLQERLVDDLCSDAFWGGAASYYIDNFGEESFNYAVKENGLIDEDALAEYCVDADGVAHFLASYDDEENEFEFEGVTYYIYRRG